MSVSTVLSTALAGLAITTSCLQAQVPGCEPSWQINNALPGADNVGDVVAWDPDGAGPLPEHIVICGYAGNPYVPGLRGYGGNTMHWGVAICNPATNEWSTLGNSPTTTTQNFARLGVDSLGRLYATTGQTIYRWQQGAWVNIGQTASQHSRFTELIAGDNGDLIAIGSFASINGVPAIGAARFDGLQWHAMGQGIIGTPIGAFRRQNGNIVAYGPTGYWGGVTYTGLVEWDGSNWNVYSNTPFATTNGATELLSGDLIAGSSDDGLFRFDGTTWTSMGVGAGEPIVRLHTRSNGDLIVAGNFVQYAGMPARYLASWNGTTWSTLGSHPDTPKTRELVNMANGDLLVGGQFKNAGNAAAVNVAIWDSSQWQGLGGGFNDEITTLKRLNNGDILAAGDFTGLACANGERADRIARFDGNQWHALGAGFNRIVNDVTELPNGDLVAVGDFVSSGATSVTRVARWNGTTWSPLGTGGEAVLQAVTVLANGDIVVGGYTFIIGGVPCRHLGRWDGSAWHAFGSGVTATIGAYGVDALLTMPNGDLIVGGRFTNVAGVPANGVARFDGTTWHTMPVGTNTGLGPVYSLYVDPTGTLFAATAGQLWQWDDVNNSWAGLGANSNFAGTVECYATLPNGQLLTGSTDTGFLPQPLANSNLQRWNTGLLGATPFAEHVPGSINGIVLEDDGSVLIAGDFEGTRPNGPTGDFVPNGFLVRLAPTCPATSTAVGAGCIGAAGAATLASNTVAWLGSQYSATADGMPANSIALELFGNSTIAAPLPLPSAPGCLLLTTPVVANALPTATGTATSSFSVPESPALVGVQFTQQVVALDFTATGIQAVSTNALELTIGAL